MKVLIADDDADHVDLLRYALRREGHEVITATDGQQALARWQAEQPDIVLLDGRMPKMDGFEVCRRIRHESRTPVILLTARSEEEDVVRGLQVGADDYVTKPFSARQLAARMNAVLRRTQEHAYHQVTSQARVGNLVLECDTHEVTARGRSVQLTKREFKILHMLALNAGRVVPYSRLVEYGWGSYDEAGSTLLKTHVSHLRAKLGLGSRGPATIRSVPGVGCTLSGTDEAAQRAA